MALRETLLVEGEHYHVYNQAVDKRTIFEDEDDFGRFMKSIEDFNQEETIGSIYAYSFEKKPKKPEPLVHIIAYCINPNHYHFILEQQKERGIEKFMQKLGTGYAKYFNNKYERRGALFQGKYKAKIVDGNDYLLHLSAYVNLNYEIHGLGHQASKSSFMEYIGENTKAPLCKKDIVLSQFKNGADYKEFARESITETVKKRAEDKLLNSLLSDI